MALQKSMSMSKSPKKAGPKVVAVTTAPAGAGCSLQNRYASMIMAPPSGKNANMSKEDTSKIMMRLYRV